MRAADSRERQGDPTPAIGGQRLRIHALGPLRVESSSGSLGGDWIDHRAGQVLRILICAGHAVVPTDVIAEAIWPHAGSTASNTVRHFIHALRRRLEPERPKHTESSLIVARRGGYTLSADGVWIDVEEFERSAELADAAVARGDRRAAIVHYEHAASMYRDDFLIDEPYAEWLFSERERLRAAAADVLRRLGELHRDEPESAVPHLLRLAELEPFDSDVQRDLIAAWLRLGRRSRAVRHYQSFELRLVRAFGEQPDFGLAELAADQRERLRAAG